MGIIKFAKSAGCAGKLPPDILEAALRNVPKQDFEEILVGFENSDDAGVYLLRPDLALVQTVDFFPPMVDDPFIFGQVATANALSDIYAMGGVPHTALSIVGFPTSGADNSILREMMQGGLTKLNEAGVALLGGHSVRDEEIKLGYSVTGTVDVANIKQNKGAHPGDQIVLTKRLGTGLITTALKRGEPDPSHVDAAIQSMCMLNRDAAMIALRHQVHAMTDVTGFGLAGHSLEVARASNLSMQIDHQRLPILDGALEYSRRGYCAGGLQSNRNYYASHVRLPDNLAAEFSDIVFDPQTSGGLLMFVSADDAQAMIRDLENAGLIGAHIGQTQAFSGHFLTIV